MNLTALFGLSFPGPQEGRALAWATDVHLNFAREEELAAFCAELREADGDAILLTGDIAEAPTLKSALKLVRDRTGKRVYFVLGNHDFYYGSIAKVRAATRTFAPGVVYLARAPGFVLGDVVLVGVDGWGDGRAGNFRDSRARLSDQQLIRDFAGMNHAQLGPKLEQLGADEAHALRAQLATAVALRKKVLVACHVPPFLQSSYHAGKPSDDDFAPFFVWVAGGEVLLEFAKANPEHQFLVLCGHTHSESVYRPLPNLRVMCGKARYHHPVLNGTVRW